MDTQRKALQKGKITIPAKIRETRNQRRRLPETGNTGQQTRLISTENCANPTELLSGLAEGVPIKEPIKQELRKAAASGAEKKLSRIRK